MVKRSKEYYRKHYDTYQGTPEQIKKRSERNKARRKMEKKVGKAALKGKDVAHKKPLSKGGSNQSSNLSVQSKSKNRGHQLNRGNKYRTTGRKG